MKNGQDQDDDSEITSLPLRQLWLLKFKNPLISRFGREFFSSIPKLPGVYLMRNDRDQIVYIGKSKCLRERLKSYTRVNIDNASRKVLRLVHSIRSIQWEILPDEKSALLRENQLLRAHRPYFNVINTSPHTYLFAHLRLEDGGIRFHLSMTHDKTYPHVYGAFKGMGMILRAQKAILRLLWASFNEIRNGFEFPSILTKRKKADHYLFKLPETVSLSERLELYGDLKRFYNGTSNRLIVHLIERLLLREDLAPFVRAYLQNDIEQAVEFYKRCANRNKRIRIKLKIKDKTFAQEQVDDLLVLFNFEKEGESKGSSG